MWSRDVGTAPPNTDATPPLEMPRPAAVDSGPTTSVRLCRRRTALGRVAQSCERESLSVSIGWTLTYRRMDDRKAERMRTWTRFVGQIAAGCVVGVLAFTGGASAGNTHTVSGVYHGLGDGANNDYYVHNFTEYGNTNWKGTALKDFNGTVIAQDYGNLTHVHNSWDTSPNSECGYSSHNYAYNGPVLNPHDHLHHLWC